MTLSNVLKFLRQLGAQITASLTSAGRGAMGYQDEALGDGKGFYGNVDGTIKKFLMAGDATVTPNASATVSGSVEIADAAEVLAGTDTGATGATLAITPSQLKAVSDNAVQLAEDISNSTLAPRIAQSTSDGGLLLRNVLNTVSARVKAFAGGVQVRNSADNDFAELQAKNGTFGGDVVISGNLTVSGTQTTVNTTDTAIKDNEIVLNEGELGAGVTLNDAGLRVERGSLTDVRIGWRESLGKFIAGAIGSEKVLARGYAETLSSTAALTHVVAHNLNTEDITITILDITKSAVFTDWSVTDANSITLNFGVPVSDYRVIVTGV